MSKKIKVHLSLLLCFTVLLTNSLAMNVKDVKVLENQVVDSAEEEVQDIVKETVLNRNQIVGLLAYGYTENEILEMTMEEADEILTAEMSYEEKSIYYKHIAPRSLEEYVDKFPVNYFDNNVSARSYCSVCGYTPSSAVSWNHATATDGYTGDGCFHEDSGTVQSNIYSKCWYAKMLAMTIFDVTSSSGLMFDYYMFGENYGAAHPDWAHEGVDMKYYNGAAVYSPISGVVTKSSNTNEWVSIYNSSLGITMNFQHITDVDGLGTLKEGNTVSVGQYLGEQSTSNSHVHVQVCDHSSCTSVHSGRDVSLTCIEPYGYH